MVVPFRKVEYWRFQKSNERKIKPSSNLSFNHFDGEKENLNREIIYWIESY